MDVYVVVNHYQYDGARLIGAAASQEKGKALAQDDAASLDKPALKWEDDLHFFPDTSAAYVNDSENYEVTRFEVVE